MEWKEHDRMFIERRRRLVRAWPVVGIILLALILGLFGWLLLTKPLLSNPWTVSARLTDGSIPLTTMSLMAAMLPVVLLLCLFVILVAVLFAFAAFANEKKYLSLIDRLIQSLKRAPAGTAEP